MPCLRFLKMYKATAMMISAKIAIIPTVNPIISCKKKFNTEKKTYCGGLTAGDESLVLLAPKVGVGDGVGDEPLGW